MAGDDAMGDADLEDRLAATGAQLRSRPGGADAGRYVVLARRRTRRRAAAGAACVAVVAVSGLLIGVRTQDSGVVRTAAGPTSDSPEGRVPVWFAAGAAPVGTVAHTVGDWGVIAPVSFETRELPDGCGTALMDPASPDVQLDKQCTPLSSADPALVFAHHAPAPDSPAGSSTETTAIAGEPAALVASNTSEQVFVVGLAGDTTELLRSTLTSVPAGPGAPGEVLSGGARTEVPPGAPPLPDYRPGVPTGFDLTSTAGSSPDARFRLIDSVGARARFVNVCVSNTVPDPGACSGGDGVGFDARTEVVSAGQTWRCSSPIRCISAGTVDVTGSDRFVAINVVGGLLTQAEVEQLLVWAPRA